MRYKYPFIIFLICYFSFAQAEDQCFINDKGSGFCINEDSISDMFLPEEIDENLRRFVDVVFGNHPPTLKNYYEFSSVHEETERTLEERSCGILFKNGDSIDNQKCSDYLKFRRENEGNVESLYFKLLREKVRFSLNKLQIGKIGVDIEGYCALVRTTESDFTVKICHASSKSLAELGIVLVSEINGIRADKFLEINYKE